MRVNVIGGGLAGSEAAWQLSKRGVSVRLYEMRGTKPTHAHVTDNLAELVCSNSFRSSDVNNAVGLLHEEMRRMDSLILKCADMHRIPAGGAFAVDRHGFSAAVQSALEGQGNVEIIREEITALPEGEMVVIASGPLTSDALSQEILKLTGEDYLAFYDAIAPIVHKDSINFDIAWFQSRYDKGDGKDYINCPMSEKQYYDFIDALLASDKLEFKDWEKDTPYFDGCLPIEVMAARGRDTLRFGPMKPVGLTNPNSDEKPYAVVQLRQDNKLGTLYNIVGFQTKLKYGSQKEVLQMIPGLENADFARLGGLHRNTFIKSPILLDKQLRLKKQNNLRFAGQITGVEGYLESAACGLLAGIFAANECNGVNSFSPPEHTALGSLLNHITGDANPETFQPMNVNYGLFPPLEFKGKKLRGADRRAAYSQRALEALAQWEEIKAS
jgi:methylenetetrahydrofolate--tRNA-(uracil-5-)-methyltransferase